MSDSKKTCIVVPSKRNLFTSGVDRRRQRRRQKVLLGRHLKWMGDQGVKSREGEGGERKEGGGRKEEGGREEREFWKSAAVLSVDRT